MKYSIPEPTIYHITEIFYQKAVNDILIGYHFNQIKPQLDQHIRHISDFWNIQINQVISKRSFDLLNTHRPLKATTGQLNRWKLLFFETLNQAVEDKIINQSQMSHWKELIEKFSRIFINSKVLLR